MSLQTINSLLELLRKTSVELPDDVSRTLDEVITSDNSLAENGPHYEIIQANRELAKKNSVPLWPDTGSIIFYVDIPRKYDEESFAKDIRKAVTKATKKGFLDLNSLDPITGGQTGNNLGPGAPTIIFRQVYRKDIAVRLLLVSASSENRSTQYSLPDRQLGAGRDIDGIRKCILDTAHRASALVGGPGVLGVGIGGDRSSSFALAREQFLRRLTDINTIAPLAKLEQEILDLSNQKNPPPLMGVKIGAYNRLRDSYFVSVAYKCWCLRRQGALLNPRGKIKKWLY